LQNIEIIHRKTFDKVMRLVTVRQPKAIEINTAVVTGPRICKRKT